MTEEQIRALLVAWEEQFRNDEPYNHDPYAWGHEEDMQVGGARQFAKFLIEKLPKQ